MANPPLTSQNLCICAQFWRYQHYLLPLWPWGITKIVCLNLGSFRNTQPNGSPFPSPSPSGGSNPPPTYRTTIRKTPLLLQNFNPRPLTRHDDALQSLLRHTAALDMASSLKFCASTRGIEHRLIKTHFAKLSAIQDLPGGFVTDAVAGKLGRMAPTAGYAGDAGLTDVAVWFWDGGYTAGDREALGRLGGDGGVLRAAHLPPVGVLGGEGEGEGVDGGWEGVVDERTLVYAPVGEGLVGWGDGLGGCRPGAVIWGGGHAVDVER
jgi:hypothetical protein